MMGATPSTAGVAVIVVFGGLITVLLTGWLQTRSKKQDYKRQDEVAAEALRQQEEVAKQAAEDREAQTRYQAELTRQAEGVAQLLLASQKDQAAGTKEVARLAATAAGVAQETQTVITLSYPNGDREDIMLVEIPRVGEFIRLSNGANHPWLSVERVLWVEGTMPPHVIISVHPMTQAEKDKDDRKNLEPTARKEE